MNPRIWDLGLPLLTKDLIEQSQSRRMYGLRVVCALLLYLFALGLSIPRIHSRATLLESLGVGREILQRVIVAEVIGIYLLVPLWMSGAIAGEKERQTLPLLLVTRLGRWRILLEKYLAVVVRVGAMLSLALPLIAITYPLGGLTGGEAFWGIWFVLMSLLHVAGVGLLCTCWFQTTSGAYLGTYAVLLVSALCGTLHMRGGLGDFSVVWKRVIVPEAYFSDIQLPIFVRNSQFVWSVLQQTAWFLWLSGFALLLSRLVFVPRALQRESGEATWETSVSRALSERWWGRGLAWICLPVRTLHRLGDAPIQWREWNSSVLRWVGCFCLACLIGGYKISVVHSNSGRRWAMLYLGGFEIIGLVFWMASLGSGVLQRERIRQTLDVLLVTPIPSVDLLRQKLMRSRRIWLGICLYLFLPCLFASSFHEVNFFAMGVVYLPLVFWMGFGASLYTRNQTQSLFVTIGAIVAWCVVPIFSLIVMVQMFRWGPDGFLKHGIYFAALLSPFGSVIGADEYVSRGGRFMAVVLLLVNYLGYGAIWWGLRRWVLSRTMEVCGRLDPVHHNEELGVHPLLQKEGNS